MKSKIQPFLCALAAGALFVAPVRAEDLKPDAEGFIRDWLMLAPIPLEEGSMPADEIAKDIVEKEGALAPKDGDKTKTKSKELTWKAVHAKEFSFDFSELLGSQSENVVGYMVTYIVCDNELTDVTLLAGGNDESRIYLNGKAVFTASEARTLEKDSDKVEKLTLNKGVNTVVFKVINETNNWQGCLRFNGKDGKPLTSYTVKLAP